MEFPILSTVKKMTKVLLNSGTTISTCKTMDESLEQLVKEAQQYNHQTKKGNVALTKLVEEILRSRSICRPLGGQPLWDVQQEIYEQVQQQLLNDLNQELDKYNSQLIPLREWINRLRNHAFRKILKDSHLKELAIVAQQYPPSTVLRQHILGELVEAIRLSGKLCRPHHRKFTSNFYELLYDEAVVETLSYVCRNIDKYDPQRGKNQKFITWVNFRLDKCVIDCRRRFNQTNVKDLPGLNDLERIEQPQETPSLSEIIREYIEEDSENIFRKTQIRNHPDANFQAIALARFAGKTWEDISSELGIVIPTLSSFFQRCCRKFAPQFRSYLQN